MSDSVQWAVPSLERTHTSLFHQQRVPIGQQPLLVTKFGN